VKPEYQEGPKAAEAFVQLGRPLFQAPKTALTKKPKKAAKKAVRHKPSGKGKAWKSSSRPVPGSEWRIGWAVLPAALAETQRMTTIASKPQTIKARSVSNHGVHRRAVKSLVEKYLVTSSFH
jgi:hypothetical protein